MEEALETRLQAQVSLNHHILAIVLGAVGIVVAMVAGFTVC
jgi:hypothetical protein